MTLVLPTNKRVSSVPALIFNTTGGYRTANPGGPAGSATMSFFVVINVRRPISGSGAVFGRSIFGNAGWAIWINGGNLQAEACNSTPARVVSPTTAVSGVIWQNVPLVYVASYAAGKIQTWANGVSQGATTLGAGYTALSQATGIGCRADSATTNNPNDIVVAECGMLDNFDITTTVAAVTAQWQEDLQQGRPLTWPRTAVVNSDWSWSCRDVVGGAYGKLTWTDRFSGVDATRVATALPQAAQIVPRF